MAGRLEARIIKRIEEKFIDKFDIKTTRVRNETGLPEKCYKVDLTCCQVLPPDSFTALFGVRR
ncbi:MAG: hypothetical protein Q8O10_05155 [candidate division Zixibacteria bacterium]|nr:hypothetical protein [candidate division Zixibacteria bacterium]